MRRQFDGFVVTGSRHDAHGPEDWISKLCEVLQRIHANKQKVLGVCFGHQVEAATPVSSANR